MKTLAIISRENIYSNKAFSGSTNQMRIHLGAHFNVVHVRPDNKITRALDRVFTPKNRGKKGRFPLVLTPMWLNRLNRLVLKHNLKAAGADYALSVGVAHATAGLKTSAIMGFVSDLTQHSTIDALLDTSDVTSKELQREDALEREACAASAFVCVPNRYAAESYINDLGISPDKIHVIPWGMNMQLPQQTGGDEHFPCAYKKLRESGTFSLVFVGVDPISKRLGFALEVMDVLNREASDGSEYMLHVMGIRQADQIPHPHAVYHGFLDKDTPEGYRAVTAIYEKADLFFLPTAHDTICISAIEAGAFGLPVVITNIGGTAETVLNGVTGRVLDLDAAAADYAAAIQELLGDPQRYEEISAAAMKRAHNVFSWEAWACAVAQLYEREYSERHTRR